MTKVASKIVPDLIPAAQRGDLAAFNALISVYQDAIYRLAYWMCMPEAGCEEAMEVVLQGLWRRLPRYRRGNFRLWVYRESVSLLRPSFGGRQFRRTNGRSLIHNLAYLEPDQRLTIVLVDLEGLEYEEAAFIMGVSKKVLRSRLAQARVVLSDSLTWRTNQ